MALRNVLSEPLANSTKGSFIGYLSEPHSTECSIICGAPVESKGGVRNPMKKTLLSSSSSGIIAIFAFVFLWLSK